MNRLPLLPTLTAAVLLSVLCGAKAPLRADQTTAPFLVALADDDDTRGDWIGTYGTYAYVLCGMRSPDSLYGGQGWPLDFGVSTGDPQETARAWLSTVPAERDRSVLWEPNGLRRTPASFDDHGETRPLGQGPDLHVRISVPGGRFLISLYFFEMDWIQYRAYRIRVFAGSTAGPLLLETEASNFFKGKYKRFVAIGPAELLIVIERGQSPNTQVSGIFVDRAEFPSLSLFERTADREVTESIPAPADDETATRAAEDALAGLLAASQDQNAQAEYVRRERAFFTAMQNRESMVPGTYYRELDKAWARAEERMAQAVAALTGTGRYLDARLLQYYAARAHWNQKATRQWAQELAQFLLERSLTVSQPWLGEARYLRECALGLMEEGRRAEASPFLQAYVTFCLKRETPETSKENLVFVAERALKAGVPLPAARALSAWQDKHGRLSTKERLLLGSLHYIGGQNAEAFEVLKSVEPEMGRGSQHKWCLIAMITALLRMDRLADAETLIGRLELEYPGAPELDEAKYRLGAYHFDKRQLKQARECFNSLFESTGSELYRRMSNEYLGRITHLEDVARETSKGG